MLTLIGHASGDEKGNIKGGASGDQTKKEVYTRSWYNRPWNVVLRPKRKEVANKLVKAMKSACSNNLIGYDQNQRNTLLTQARKHKYDIAKVNVKCECDCSSLVSVCCMYAGIEESKLYQFNNCSTTMNLRKRLIATGEFEELKQRKYLTSSEYLKVGDILLYEGHHVAINLTDGLKNDLKEDVYFKQYKGNSRKIDEVFKSINVPSKNIGSWVKRKPIALKNGIKNYQGRAEENLKLISLARQGKLKRYG